MFSSLSNSFRKLWNDTRGSGAVLFAISLLPLMTASGMAIDVGRAYLLKAKLGQALDAAALAGARAYESNTRDAEVRMFFQANFPNGYLGANVSELSISESPEAGTITVAATATIDTTLLGMMGQDNISVGDRAVVQRAGGANLEMVLIMDNTGSMRSSGKISDMKAAARQLVNQLHQQSQQNDTDLYIGLVPYVATVNIGNDRKDWLEEGAVDRLQYEFPEDEVPQYNCGGASASWKGDFDACVIGDFETRRNLSESECNDIGIYDSRSRKCLVSDGWKGCVEARYESGDDVTDATPDEVSFVPQYWERSRQRYRRSYWRNNTYFPSDIDERESTNTAGTNGKGPNIGCGPEVTPLTAQHGTVVSGISEMDAWSRGGTMTNVGMVWGWRMLSPKWRGVWDDSETLPHDYNDPEIQKVAVILTDGYNQWSMGHPDGDFTAYQRLGDGNLGTTSSDRARRELNDKTLEVCQSMKAEGITIYAITFGVANDSGGRAIREIFSQCASSNAHYFDDYNGDELLASFLTIANNLGHLRIIE
ncbi:pilus assembly protein TadG-related protein [Rhodovibrionaceae bacterium A322]